AELLGDDGQGGGGGLADAQGEVAGRPAHADDEVPAQGGAGVLGDVADDAHPDLPGRLEPERGGRARQGQVVVDGLGDVGDADGAWGLGVDLAAGEGGVVAADGHQHGDVELAQHVQDVAHVLLGLGRVGAGGAEDRPAAEVDSFDVVDGEGSDVVGVALDQ